MAGLPLSVSARVATKRLRSSTLREAGLSSVTLARSLVEAFGSGDDAAMQRVMDHFHLRRSLSWDQPSNDVRLARLRRGVQERLGVRIESGTESASLPLADTQILVARSLGFTDWNQLVKDIQT